MDNNFIESFNGKLRDECLNEHGFLNIKHMQDVIEKRRFEYNEKKLHSSLGNITPSEFVKEHQTMLQKQGLNLNLVLTSGQGHRFQIYGLHFKQVKPKLAIQI